MAQTIELNFEGYWSEKNKLGVPSQGGVYCVYRCTTTEGRLEAVKQLLYIGKSSDVNDRIANHEKLEKWESHLKDGESLYYSFAPKVLLRDQAEAALIYKHRPPINTEYKYSFPFPDTLLKTSGKSALLDQNVIVQDTRINERNP